MQSMTRQKQTLEHCLTLWAQSGASQIQPSARRIRTGRARQWEAMEKVLEMMREEQERRKQRPELAEREGTMNKSNPCGR